MCVTDIFINYIYRVVNIDCFLLILQSQAAISYFQIQRKQNCFNKAKLIDFFYLSLKLCLQPCLVAAVKILKQRKGYVYFNKTERV